MFGDKEKEEKKVLSEIDSARNDLEAEVEKRGRSAKEKLDEILSEKKMEFCTRCGKKISSRIDWAGKCLHKGCEKLVCEECWHIKKHRHCREHAQDVSEESGETGPYAEREGKGPFAGEEKDLKIDLHEMLEEHDASRKDRLLYLTSEYANWLFKRIERFGPIDWTPKGIIKKGRIKMEKEGENFAITINVKKWFRTKPKLSIVVLLFDSKEETDMNSIMAYLQKQNRKYDGYKLLVLVGDKLRMDVISFVNKFYDRDFSLYMVEPKTGHLYYNIKDRIASGYSRWLNQKKKARNFRESLKRMADMVSGSFVVSEEMVADHFGFDKHDVRKILKSCSFLSSVKGTDTFVLKSK